MLVLATGLVWLMSGCVTEYESKPVTTGPGPIEEAARELAGEVKGLEEAADRTVGGAVATALVATRDNPAPNLPTAAAGAQLEIAAGAIPGRYLQPDTTWLARWLSEDEAERRQAGEAAREAAGEAAVLRDQIERLRAHLAAQELRALAERKSREAEAARRVQEAQKAAERAIEEARLANVAARAKANAIQSLVLTIFGAALILAGGVCGYLKHGRMAIVGILLGAGMIAFARALNVVPDWVWSVAVGSVAAGVLAGMWWAYRVGLFQRPEAGAEEQV